VAEHPVPVKVSNWQLTTREPEPQELLDGDDPRRRLPTMSRSFKMKKHLQFWFWQYSIKTNGHFKGRSSVGDRGNCSATWSGIASNCDWALIIAAPTLRQASFWKVLLPLNAPPDRYGAGFRVHPWLLQPQLQSNCCFGHLPAMGKVIMPNWDKLLNSPTFAAHFVSNISLKPNPVSDNADLSR